MYELQQAGPQSYYINSPAKIGIYRQTEAEVYLIDSGNDKEAAKKVLKMMKQNGWLIKGIINTHSNADHIGGNRYIQEQTGCPIYSGGIEAAFIRYPILEPSFLYGGYPFKELRGKFLMAKESNVSDFSSSEFPSELELINLPGHFFDMVGVRTPDNTVFLADCVSSSQTLEKYGVTFIYDIAQYLATLDMIESIEAGIFVPSHATPTKDIKPLVAINRAKVYEIEARITEICSVPKTIDEIIQALFQIYGLSMNIEQYVLLGSTTRSYLSWMKDRDKLDIIIEQTSLKWQSKIRK